MRAIIHVKSESEWDSVALLDPNFDAHWKYAVRTYGGADIGMSYLSHPGYCTAILYTGMAYYKKEREFDIYEFMCYTEFMRRHAEEQ